MDMIKNAKKLKGSDAYINEHRTKCNSDLAHKAKKGTYNIYMDTLLCSYYKNKSCYTR